MKKTWVLVAENSRARLFDWRTKEAIEEVSTYAHPESRLHEQDLTADLPGRTFDSAAQGRHAQEETTDIKDHEAQVFAKQLADELERQRTQGKFEQLIVIAAPQFLGLLRTEFSDPLHKIVVKELDKNLAHESVESIRKHLPESIPV